MADPTLEKTKTLDEMLAEMQARIDAAEAKNASLQQQLATAQQSTTTAGGFAGIKIVARLTSLFFKGGDGKDEPGKGTLAVYGLGRMPLSYYPEQWLAILCDSALVDGKSVGLRQRILQELRRHANAGLKWKRPEVQAAFLASDLGK